MLTTLFPNDKPLSIADIEAAIRIARNVKTERLVIFVNSYEAEHIMEELRSSGVLDGVFIYESEFIDRGKIYVVEIAGEAELIRRFMTDHQRTNLLRMQEDISEYREISEEDEIKNIKKRIRKAKSYLEKRELQKKLGHLEKTKRRKAQKRRIK